MYDYVGAQPSPAQVEEGEGRQAVEVGGSRARERGRRLARELALVLSHRGQSRVAGQSRQGTWVQTAR